MPHLPFFLHANQPLPRSDSLLYAAAFRPLLILYWNYVLCSFTQLSEYLDKKYYHTGRSAQLCRYINAMPVTTSHSPGHCPDTLTVTVASTSRSAIEIKRFLFIFLPARDLQATSTGTKFLPLLVGGFFWKAHAARPHCMHMHMRMSHMHTYIYKYMSCYSLWRHNAR